MARSMPSFLLLLGLACWPAAALQLQGNSDDELQKNVTINGIFDEFGGHVPFCMYFGFAPRPEGERRPRIVFATVVGNEGQHDVYDLAFSEVYPLVDRIVAADPPMTHQGFPRQLSMNMSDVRWQRYERKLRHLALENPIPGERINTISPGDPRVQRPGHAPMNRAFLLEQWIRAQLYRGLQDNTGAWDIDDEDILLVADSDEIPLRESLVALSECVSPNFARVKQKLSSGEDVKAACASDAKVLLQSQVFEYYMDCPTTSPKWWHPDAILAVCVKSGGVDTEDVRTGSSGQMTPVVAARHIHNFAMSDEDVIFKYTHYVEPRSQRLDAGLSKETHQEMRWRGCDPAAPELGPRNWYMNVRPSNDLVRLDNKRGYSVPLEQRRGLEKPFALLTERPELADKIFWKNHGERGNPFVGMPGGTHSFKY